MSLPKMPRRKNVRLPGYDYSQAGGYYVTIVTQGRECLLGEIHNDEMVLNDAGVMVVKWWNELAHKFPSVTQYAFVVMPNHFHGIIFNHEIVGADLRVGPGDEGAGPSEMGAHVGAPLQIDGVEHFKIGEHTDAGEHIGSPLRTYAPLSQIVQWFKTMTTNEYIRGVKQFRWQPFSGKLWQRNYYEHIIRNEEDYERIANYIATNPVNWEGDEENR